MAFVRLARRRRGMKWLVPAVVVALAATIGNAGPARAASSGSAGPSGADVTIGTPPQRPAAAVASSAPDVAESLDFDVVLAPRDPQALDTFVQAVSTPGSPQYRQFLARGEFGPRFGASAQAIETVTAALRKRGLHVGRASSNGLSIPVSGTVAQVGAALHTSFTTYRLNSGKVGLVNTTAPRLPAGVARHVQGFVGLNQLIEANVHRPARARPALSGPVLSGPVLSAAATGTAACTAASNAAKTAGAYLPAQLAQHYGLDSLYPRTAGTGVTVALFELEPFDPADVAAYQTCFGTSAKVTVHPVDGGAGTGGGTGEAALDIQTIIGLAPGADIAVYSSPNDGASVYDQFRQIANDNIASIVSDSWGLCEAESGVAELASLERPILQQMAAQGQTVLAATGDSGSEGCYSPPDSTVTSLSVWEPASQPEVTAVGGTTVDALDAADTSWNSSSGASGGGVSRLWQMPAYQRTLGRISDSTAAACGAPTGQLCREVPDVSASADLDHGSLAYFNGKWHVVGGTSVATPIWAAALALVNATCASGPVGFVNPALYELAKQHTSVVDVASGPNNDFTNSNGGKYATAAGYDLTTGLGRPDAAALASGLCPPVAPAGSGTMTVDPTVIAPSAAATLTFTYTPAAGTGLTDGELELTIPGTWTLPTTSPTVTGYTTASAGKTTVVSNTIVVSGLTVPVGGSVTITYGDTSAGAPPARAPSVGQITVFAAKSRTGQAGSSAPLAINPAVRVSTTGTTPGGQGMLTRIAGIDRIATAIDASKAGFSTDRSAGAVVLARSDLYPDALAGVPLAAHDDGPLLLTTPTQLLPVVAAEIERVLPIGRTVYLLGSPVSLASSIEVELQQLGYVPVRLAGPSRYETAIAIAKRLGDPGTVFEVDGTNFPDALSAGTAAVISHGAILFTFGTKPYPSTSSYLTAHPGDVRYAVGGPAVAADPGASPLAGIDRYATSAIVAQRFFTSPSVVGTASGMKFPDALSGGPVTALAGGPLVLVPPDGVLPKQSQAYLSQIAATVSYARVFGGTPSVSTAIADQVAQSLVLVPPPS